LCWALDNNLTRKIFRRDSVKIAASRVWPQEPSTLAWLPAFGGALPAPEVAAACCSGRPARLWVSLALFVVALRQLRHRADWRLFLSGAFYRSWRVVCAACETPDAFFLVASS